MDKEAPPPPPHPPESSLAILLERIISTQPISVSVLVGEAGA